MRPSRTRKRRLPLATLAILLVAGVGFGCAPAYQLPDAPSPDQIPALEARAQQAPVSTSVLVQLGAAYREAGRLDEAAAVLEQAVTTDPESGSATLFLGLTYEDQERFGEARAAYRALLDSGAGAADLRGEVQRRLPLLERRELESAVREAVAMEDQLQTVRPEPNTVAVFPFEYLGADPAYSPLARAMAEMLQTDLGRVGRVRLLERLRIQALLDELQLAEEGFVDARTASRSGQILGASRIVQGLIVDDPAGIGVRAAVLPTPAGDPSQIPSLTDQDALEEFYELQARLALQVHSALGIQLTAAEEELILDRPTRNLQALLAWGRGLEAEDRGDYAEAFEHYQTASDLDADFAQPRDDADRTSGMIDAEQVSTADLTGRAWAEVEVEPVVSGPTAGPVDFDGLEGIVPGSIDRDAVVEILGTEGISAGSRTLLEIIIRRP